MTEVFRRRRSRALHAAPTRRDGLESSHSVDPALLTNLALPDLHPLGSSSPKALHQRAVVHSKAQNMMAEGWHLL